MASEREDDGGIGRQLRERLPRHPASSMLRAAVVESLHPGPARQPWCMLWMPPACSAVATALVMLLWIAPSLPTAPGLDPARLMERAVLDEHARNIFWGEARADVRPGARGARLGGGICFSNQ